MTRIEALLLLSTLSTSILAAEPSRPRGVGPEFAKFYKDAESFTCIGNPSIKIGLSQVNDEYCDCPDGSDEPGTAACTSLSNLSPPQPIAGNRGAVNTTAVLPGYYCKNKGHVPSYIPHTYVNDGVCDYELCCDGSDEWEGVGGIKCEDRCKEIGKEWRKLEEVKEKGRRNALKKRVDLVNEAAALRKGMELGIKKLEAEVKMREIEAAGLKKKYDEVERRERGKVIMGGGEGKKASKTTVLAGLAKQRVEELREALVGAVGKRDTLREKVKQLEEILSTFKKEYNPNFNDEGVKRAVKAWEDYAAAKAADTDDSAEDRDYESISKPDSESEGINWAEWETEEESDVEVLYKFEAYLPGPIRDWVHQKLIDFRVLLVENGILADNANSGTESKVVSDARTAFQNVNNDLDSKKVKLGEQQADLEKDYGIDSVFRALKGKCVTKDSGEYEYELCWMDGTKQKSKKGGSTTGMGTFTRFDRIEVDEEVGADGKGVGKGERIVMMFENGQHCWNGPNRQTTVVLACAENDEVWKVVEQEKCMYRMDVGTPAVCEAVDGGKTGAGGGKKDEL